ncbi:MAG: aminoacyl-tRNA hydrolase [Chloroflexi bacterium]|nr:aminoacyl-tRNA hydrolase [Chloroflexota bacterium]MCI0574866.1 aminoacyl-tRNA hydrolase [Chloroflexota bacterium]MCI0650104.1 aminoacyl-tRNA hydrolase [Chloroflexota bacterium]MCI0731188.1 aminoacyl-tRNA hydrolase [Chloroflexota bacterium]
MMGEADSNRCLIVGLGNPGRTHRANRHNIGFMVVDALAEKHGIAVGRVQHKALIGDGRIAGRPVILAKPQTFMNLSGEAVGPLANYYKVPLANLLVIYDEIDLPFGALRLREKGSSGGHNGMRSIINRLGQDFPRLRLGIGRPPGRMPPAAYVLQDFAKEELPLAGELIDQAIQAIETFLVEGIDRAMTRHNRQPVAND